MSNSLKLRKIQSKDISEVIKILEGQIGKEYFKDIRRELEDCLRGTCSGIVAKHGNELVGYASWRKRVEAAYLETIVVKENQHGRGIGRFLLNEVEQEVTHRGIGLLNSVTDSDALKTIGFYLKNGFQISGYVDNEFIAGTKQVHLCKFLGK